MSKVRIMESKPPATREQIDDFLQEIGHSLPEDYIQFLLSHNGGTPEPRTFDVEWENEDRREAWGSSLVARFLAFAEGDIDLVKNYRLSKGRIPPGLIPIAYDLGGNYIVMGVERDNLGKIYLALNESFDAERDMIPEAGLGLIANSFLDFLSRLHP